MGKDDLFLHQRTHTGVRLYECDDCDQSFKTIWDLKRHKETQANVRPFKGDDFGNTFTRN